MAKVGILDEGGKGVGRGKRSLDQGEVIKRFNDVHGDFYDYSEVVYKGTHFKVKIGCSEHGWFSQEPSAHLRGVGCPKCGILKTAKSHKPDRETVINNFISVHGDSYNYSEVEYKKNNIKVKIGCKVHGFFEQTPNSHLRGSGCPVCGCLSSGKSNTLNQATVISKFIATHGNRYDYSEVDYKTTHVKVKIRCKVHGVFEQTPDSHSRGACCPACAGVQRPDTITIINKFKGLHGDHYDYSNVEYKKNNVKVEIRCKDHGFFWQTPASHLFGSGCPVCAGNKKLDGITLVDNFKNVHGDRYDYSRVLYKNNRVKVEIGCPLHGYFWQIPRNHSLGIGCPKCGSLSTGEKSRLDGEVAISKLIEKHGGRYDYSRVVFNTTQDYIEIICKVHGLFKQKYNNHLQGNNCVKCSILQRSAGRKTNQEAAINNLIEKHGNRYDYSNTIYTNAKDPISIICRIHGEFKQLYANHYSGKGCIECTQSRGEIAISSYLTGKVDFEAEKRFKEHKEVSRMPFDFWIPSLNLCIEHQGVQHFKPVVFFGGKNKFIKTQQRDQKKRDFCIKNGIRLLTIRYWEFDDIEKILKRELRNTKKLDNRLQLF